MVIKESASVSAALTTFIETQELTNEQIAYVLNISKQLVSHMKRDRRPMQKDIAEQAIKQFSDCPAFAMDLIFEFSSGFTSPVLRGKALEQHRLSFKEFLLNEWADVARKIIKSEKEDEMYYFDWSKAPDQVTEREKNLIKDLIIELNEMEMAAANFRIHLHEAYLIDAKIVRDETLSRVTAKGWI
ncbi:hypothetical protein [Domibacillus tundrae]|uniref:hypothetical protein n=1 Tax=Domibacillus tundrae TaxID=1587527 RepID=UPI0006182556|nr:hypothetical protein [Domibacillus tundrae]